MRSASAILAALSGCGALWAQGPQMAGPEGGFIFDAPTRSLRAVGGSPGAALFGPALYADADYGSVAPRRDYALVVRRDRLWLVQSLGSAALPPVQISGASPGSEGITWSADGSVAVLYSRSGNWIQTIASLPESPTPGPVLSLSPLGGILAALAVGPRGDQIAIGISGPAASVYEIANGQNFVPLSVPSEPAALAFSGGGGTLYAASVGQLVALNTQDLTSKTWPLDLQDPVAVNSDPKSGKIYVAGGADQVLIALDSSSGQAIASLALSFKPTALDPLGAAGFALRPRAAGQDPLWSFVGSPSATVYFVPALPSPSRREGVARGPRR